MMDYTIQVCEISGNNCIQIIDNATGHYLTRYELERWIEYIGGVQIKRFYE